MKDELNMFSIFRETKKYESVGMPTQKGWISRIRVCFPLPFVFAALFFGGLLLLDFPKPWIDDLYFIGASLNLVNGGDFSNPLLAREQFADPHHFFGHPPLYSYVLAGWLKIFGVSGLSLKTFQMLIYLLICRSTLEVLQRHGSPALLKWLLPFVVASAFMTFGFRSEPFSIALTMIGFVMVDCGGMAVGNIFLGFLLLFFGASAASRVTLFSGALASLAMINLWKKKVSFIKLGLLSGMALLTTWMVFLAMIHFHLEEFWKNYLFVAHGRTGKSGLAGIQQFLFHLQGISWLPLILLWLLSLLLLPYLQDRALRRFSLFISMPVFILGFMGAIGVGAIWYMMLALIVAVAGWSKQLAPSKAYIVQIILAGVILMANAKWALPLIGILSGNIKPDQSDNLTVARSLLSTSEHAVLINDEIARYVFDYRIPPGVLDWDFATTYPGSLASESAPRPGDIYLVGPAIIEKLNKNGALHINLPKWEPLGVNRWSCCRYPKSVFIINSQDCVGLPIP